MKPLLLASMMAGLILPVAAQAPQDEDGPGRGVARLSLLNGDVSIRRGDSGDVVAAAPNAPLVVQDRVLTGPSSRAEIQFDWANMIRVGSNAEVRLSELEYRRYQIQIALGTTTFRVLRDSDSQVELSTPGVALRPLRRGVYRVTVHEDGSAEISVRSGEAEIYTPRGTERLTSGRTMLTRGTANDPEFQVVGSLAYDEWDRWNEDRDRALDRSRSYNYVSQDIYGAEELDSAGTWVDVPSYGRVWRPTVVADWAPYRYGRWVWIDFYGWTWVSYDSWGWAPYHYGRWFMEPGYGWCWWPGPARSHYYWRPALVAFFGWGGGGARVGVGFGNVGWVPLAPYEPYHPWYGSGGGFGNRTTIINNTTIVNNVNVVNVYRNARGTNGITGVSGDGFGRGGAHMRVSGSDVNNATLVRGQLPVTPGQESLRMADRPVRMANLPQTSEDRRFFSTRQPAPVQRVPFEQQRQRIEQSTRGTFGDGSRVAPDFGRGTNPSVGAPPADGGNRGWRRANDNQQFPTAPQPAPDTNRQTGSDRQSGGDWHRFGQPSHNTNPAPTPAPDSNYNRGGNWRRFGDTGDRGVDRAPAPQPTPQYERPERQYQPPPPRQDNPRQDNPRQDNGRNWNQGRSNEPAPMRISPPIVRERAPERPPERPAPMPAPRMESRPAPSNDGGGRGGDHGSRGNDNGRRGR